MTEKKVKKQPVKSRAVSKSKAKIKPKPAPKKRTFKITAHDIEKIAHSLGAQVQHFGNHYRIYLDNPSECRKLTLEIYPSVSMGTGEGSLITVYTPNAHLQLHHCNGYVISDLLGEVTFVGTHSGRLSGLTIEKGAACSLYANVETKLLSGDISQLGPEVMLSSIALSLTETIILESESMES
jgi:hypothetical protein